MSRPRWQVLAEVGYGLLLRLYPRAIREPHGEEMRQAFRDRCREAAAGRISAWRLLCLELAPDFAASLAETRLAEPGSPRRARLGLAALLLLGCLWLFHDAISPRILDASFAASLRWQHFQEERALARDEAQLRMLAGRLAASPDARERSMAAWLYAFVYKGRSVHETRVNGAAEVLGFAPLEEDGASALRVLASLPVTGDAETARMALAACQVGTGCDRLARAQALVRLEPRNAFGWSQLLKLHSQAGNDDAVRSDLQSLAQAGYYDDGVARGRRVLLAAAARIAPGDAAMSAAVGRAFVSATAMVNDDYAHDLRILCALQPSDAPTPGRWLQRNPGSRRDCRKAAVLLANSSGAWDSMWGWNWLDRDAPSARTSAGASLARERMHQREDYGSTSLDGRRWRPWTDAEWQAWADAELKRVATR